jgi:hypothetical protein
METAIKRHALQAMAGKAQLLLTFVLLASAVAAADLGPQRGSWNRGARSLQEDNVSNLFNQLMKQLQALQAPTLPPPAQVTVQVKAHTRFVEPFSAVILADAMGYLMNAQHSSHVKAS